MKKLIDGLRLLQNFADAHGVKANFNVGHDQCWAGSDNDFEKMSDDEKNKMYDLDWFFDEEQDAWSRWV